MVEAVLDAAGNVSDARVLSGPQELRRAALDSVLQWHFANGAAGATRTVTIGFQLPADGKPWPKQYQINLLQGGEGNCIGVKEATSKGLIKPGDWNHFGQDHTVRLVTP